MSNTYFQFKQFTIHQERCAMKVCTDACLFGAWVVKEVKSLELEVRSCLDIGAGTGLLSLMLAQETDAMIDAVEVDESAAQQALDNFEASPWKNRLQVIQGDIKRLHLGKKYDLIISNPPFFENSLKSPDNKRNLALHSDMLELDELVPIAKNNLTDTGIFAVLLPYERENECKKVAESNGFHLSTQINVRQSTKHGFFRSMFLFTQQKTETHISELSIRNENHYTTEFTTLLKEYYLHL